MKDDVCDQRKNKAMLDILYKEGGSIKFKDESLFMKILGVLLFFNKRFMTEFTTTIGSTIYLPSQKSLNDELLWITIGHELVHVRDGKLEGQWWFPFLYLYPQSFGLPALLGLLFATAVHGTHHSLYVLALLTPLLLFSPLIPATFRVTYEARAYAMTLLLIQLHARAGDISAGKMDARDLPCDITAWLDHLFTGPDYYYMARKGSTYRREIAFFFDGYAWSRWGTSTRDEMTYRYGYSVHDITSIPLGNYTYTENKDVEALFR